MPVPEVQLRPGGPAPGGRAYLPAPATCLVGRAREIENAAQLLARAGSRMVTLTGPGGIGKTRLGVEIAWTVAERFPDGVYFVPLAAVSHAGGIVGAIAQVLRLRDRDDQPPDARLHAYLGDKQILLLLDNLEQVADAAPVLGALLAAAPRLTILATSRTTLHVYGEHVVWVAPLPVPGTHPLLPLPVLAQVDAVALFVQRARAVAPEFEIGAGNAAAVAAICVRLDGLPLALELAAARMAIFSPQMLLARLDSRLDFLTGGPGDQPARHRTLRAALAWSYDLLSPAEQQLYRRFAVFAGGATLDALEHVCATTHDEADAPGAGGMAGLVEQLVHKSFISAAPAAGGETRFSMLETVREYAWEQLQASGELPDLRQRHAGWCLALVAHAGPAFDASVGAGRVALLGREQDNLRAALAWCAATADPAGARMGLRLAHALAELWEQRGQLREARAQLALALSTFACRPDPDPRMLAHVLLSAGRVETFLAADAAGLRYLDESLRLFRALDDRPALAYTLLAMGHTVIHLGDVARAQVCHTECLALQTALGDHRGIIWATNAQADLALHLGDTAAAVTLYEQALHLARTAPGPPMMGPLIALAYISAGRADYTRALEQLSEALALADALDLPTARAHSLGVLAKIAYLRGWAVPAVRLFAHAQALFDSAGLRLEPPVHTAAAEYEHVLAELQETLPAPAFQQAWITGRTQTPRQLLAGMRRRHQHAGASPRPAPVPGGDAVGRLTAREIEVLRLVAAGLTNAQAAGRLTVTPHTINMHLRAIYAKLGVTTRAGAASYALVHHLI